MEVRSCAVVALLALSLVACGAEEADSGTTTSSRGLPPASIPGSTLTTTASPPMTGEVPDGFLAAVVEDAAGRANVGSEQLEVMRAEAVEWPDGSLGCPRPGELYVQVVVSGYWVEIAGPDQTFDYRLDESGSFRLCETGS